MRNAVVADVYRSPGGVVLETIFTWRYAFTEASLGRENYEVRISVDDATRTAVLNIRQPHCGVLELFNGEAPRIVNLMRTGVPIFYEGDWLLARAGFVDYWLMASTEDGQPSNRGLPWDRLLISEVFDPEREALLSAKTAVQAAFQERRSGVLRFFHVPTDGGDLLPLFDALSLLAGYVARFRESDSSDAQSAEELEIELALLKGTLPPSPANPERVDWREGELW